MNAPKDFYLKKFDLLMRVEASLADAQFLMDRLQELEGTAPGGEPEDLVTVAGEIHNTALFVTFLKVAVSPMVEMYEPIRMTPSQIHEAMGNSLFV
jgi:hypothetical protein